MSQVTYIRGTSNLSYLLHEPTSHLQPIPYDQAPHEKACIYLNMQQPHLRKLQSSPHDSETRKP